MCEQFFVVFFYTEADKKTVLAKWQLQRCTCLSFSVCVCMCVYVFMYMCTRAGLCSQLPFISNQYQQWQTFIALRRSHRCCMTPYIQTIVEEFLEESRRHLVWGPKHLCVDSLLRRYSFSNKVKDLRGSPLFFLRAAMFSRNLKNTVVVSAGFLFLFTAYAALQNLQVGVKLFFFFQSAIYCTSKHLKIRWS